MAFDYFSSSASRRSTLSLSRDTPPSLTYSDFDTDDIEEIMASAPGEDASATMGKVLNHLDRVVEHLRARNENDAANQIAQLSYKIIENFNNTTAAWDIDDFMMGPRPIRLPIREREVSNPKPKCRKFEPGTWAAVAATPTPKSNKIIKYRPSNALKCAVSDDFRPAKTTISDKNMRVVWIQPWNAEDPMSKVTAQINQGPLLSMAYSKQDNAVCIIFQHAEHARDFLEGNADYVERHGLSLFGESTVLSGQPYPFDGGLRLMEPPANERRRLTFARSQLFTGQLTEEQFKKDLFAVVGEENVELVWLFNTGNATVVFTATAIARMIRDEFRKRGRQGGPYKDIQVSFSHDPCERPMHLITQLPISNTANHPSNSSYPPQAVKPVSGRGQSNAKSGSKIDRDGWTTVARKR